MRKTSIVSACAGMLLSSAAFGQVTVGVDDSTGPWIGFMNVSNLPAPDGDGGYQFGSGWEVPDLRVEFDDSNDKFTFFPNSIGDPNEYWYREAPGGDPGNPDNGGPGAPGNKIMEANLFQQVDDAFGGQTVTFEGEILSNSFTQAHMASIFIRDFAPDFSSFNETIVPAAPGAFSISLATDAGAGRHVQWGFQVKGENVWITDVAPFGNMMVGTIPTPASAAALGMAGLFAGRRRR